MTVTLSGVGGRPRRLISEIGELFRMPVREGRTVTTVVTKVGAGRCRPTPQHLAHPSVKSPGIAEASAPEATTGRLEVTVDNERKILGPGDAYYFESRRPHRFRCVGPVACEVVSACTPPSF